MKPSQDPRRQAEAAEKAAALTKRHTEVYATWDDWIGTCQKCGTARKGRLVDLRQPCGSCGHGAQDGS